MNEKKETHGPEVIFVLLKVWATTLVLPFRERIGRRYLGTTVLFGWPFVFFWSEFARAPNLLWLVPINLLVWLLHLVKQAWRNFRGVPEHTGYEGASIFRHLFFGSDEFAKVIVEPVLCFLVGLFIYNYTNEPDAAPYFWYGSVVLIGWQMIGIKDTQNHLDNLTDGQFENEYFMKKLRRRRF